MSKQMDGEDILGSVHFLFYCTKDENVSSVRTLLYSRICGLMKL